MYLYPGVLFNNKQEQNKSCMKQQDESWKPYANFNKSMAINPTYGMIPFIYNSGNGKTIKTTSRSLVTWAVIGETWVRRVLGNTRTGKAFPVFTAMVHELGKRATRLPLNTALLLFCFFKFLPHFKFSSLSDEIPLFLEAQSRYDFCCKHIWSVGGPIPSAPCQNSLYRIFGTLYLKHLLFFLSLLINFCLLKKNWTVLYFEILQASS